MRPAGERLVGKRPAGADRADRLEVRLQASLGDRVPQVPLQRVTLLQALVHLRLEEAGGAPPVLLRPVKGDVGALQEVVRSQPVRRVERNPDAGADQELMALDPVWLCQAGDEALPQRRRFFGLAGRGLQDRELVAPEPRDQVALPHAAAQPLGHQSAAGGRRRRGRASRSPA